MQTRESISDRLDMTPRFAHFGEIEGFSDYVESRRKVVDWIDRGLTLRSDDIHCRPGSMIDDLVRIVHSLVARITVLVDEEAMLMRVRGPSPALILGSVSNLEKKTRIQYIFQHPTSNKAEILHLTYHLEQPLDLMHRMSAFASTIDSGESVPKSDLSEVFQAILDHDYEEASSIAESSGLIVQMGLR